MRMYKHSTPVSTSSKIFNPTKLYIACGHRSTSGSRSRCVRHNIQRNKVPKPKHPSCGVALLCFVANFKDASKKERCCTVIMTLKHGSFNPEVGYSSVLLLCHRLLHKTRVHKWEKNGNLTVQLSLILSVAKKHNCSNLKNCFNLCYLISSATRADKSH